MLRLAKGVLSLPQARSVPLPVATIDDLAKPGLDSQMVNGKPQNGPFVIRRGDPILKPYKALWSHHAHHEAGDRERRLVVPPDSYGVVRVNMEDRALEIWRRTASRLHANRDFRLNSQSLTMCVTDEPTIGGRAWPTLQPRLARFTWPMVLWANSTFGLMVFWWQGNRQQLGRSSLTLTKLPQLVTLDARELNQIQSRTCKRIFDEFRTRPFLPAYEAWRDPVRQALDAALIEMLGLPRGLLSSLDILRKQWCAEPTVHGG